MSGTQRKRRAAVLAIAAVVVSAAAAATAAQGAADETPYAAVPRPQCQPGDKPDTALQGQIPLDDRFLGTGLQSQLADSGLGRASEGYICNLTLVGALTGGGGYSFDAYQNCAYVPETTNGITSTGVQVIDVSDPARPKQTATLTGAAAREVSESMRVNAKRGLLVMDVSELGGPAEWHMLDVYDLKPDCAHPTYVGSFDMSPAIGHEGWFSPDGTVYYMTTTIGGRITGLGKFVFPIDLSDTAKPKLMTMWSDVTAHGGWESDDGKTGYMCQQGGFPGPGSAGADGVRIVDTSEIQAHKANPILRQIGFIPTVDNSLCQAAYPVTYSGHPYLIQFGESTPGRAFRFGPQQCDVNPSNFAYPHIFDIGNPKKPVLVGRLMREVDLAANCEAVNNDTDPKAGSFGQVYDVHMCSPDRLHDPTILACGQFYSGLEVYDIRDPRHPKELAYYRPGTLGTDAITHPQWGDAPTTVETVGARPIVRADLGEIWFVSAQRGFHVVKFEDGVYPFRDSLSCQHDYFFDQYNPGRCDPSPSRAPSREHRCVKPGSVTISLHRLGHRVVRYVAVYVGSERLRIIRGNRRTLRLSLARLSGRQVRIAVVVHTTRGRSFTIRRAFRLCAAG